MENFFENNSAVLDDYLKISQISGSRSDYVQGGGGNTSCKFDDRLMAIKASGYKLSQIERDNAYAVLDHAAIAAFYRNSDPSVIDDVEAAGSAAAKSAVVEIPGLPVLRPSVEAGFHSLLDRFVLHTHPVYANLAACSLEGRDIVAKALNAYDRSFAFIEYIDPGAKLTFAIKDEIEKVFLRTGIKPSVIFMQNHGFIATHSDAQKCMEIHDEVNTRIAEAFGVSASDFPSIDLKEIRQGDDDCSPLFISDTPIVKEIAADNRYGLKDFYENPLYPDHMVFLSGNIVICDASLPADTDKWAVNKCTIYRRSGDVVYSCSKEEARTMEETIAAVAFITSVITRSGNTVVTMSESGREFIAGWESEKYRRSVIDKKGR